MRPVHPAVLDLVPHIPPLAPRHAPSLPRSLCWVLGKSERESSRVCLLPPPCVFSSSNEPLPFLRQSIFRKSCLHCLPQFPHTPLAPHGNLASASNIIESFLAGRRIVRSNRHSASLATLSSLQHPTSCRPAPRQERGLCGNSWRDV